MSSTLKNAGAGLDEGLGKISPAPSSTISDQNNSSSSSSNSTNSDLKERDYIGLSDVASTTMDCKLVAHNTAPENPALNLRATELTLALPGSESPTRDSAELPLMSTAPVRTDVEEKQLFPVEKQQQQQIPENPETKNISNNSSNGGFPRNVALASKSGAKRGFTEAMESRGTRFGSESSWVFPAGAVMGSGSEPELPNKPNSQPKFLSSVTVTASSVMKQAAAGGPAAWHTGGLDHSGNAFMAAAARPATTSAAAMNAKSVKEPSKDISQQTKMVQERPRPEAQPNPQKMPATNDMGISPVAKQQVVGWPPIRSFRKNTLAAAPRASDEGDTKAGSSALYVKVSMDGAPYLRKVDLKLYSCYPDMSSALEKMFSGTIGQCGTGLSESKLMDLLNGSEYVLTYEDKDGDWMLVGDVPWEMFTESCRRLRIMKGSEAIGLAPRAMEKCRNRN